MTALEGTVGPFCKYWRYKREGVGALRKVQVTTLVPCAQGRPTPPGWESSVPSFFPESFRLLWPLTSSAQHFARGLGRAFPSVGEEVWLRGERFPGAGVEGSQQSASSEVGGRPLGNVLDSGPGGARSVPEESLWGPDISQVLTVTPAGSPKPAAPPPHPMEEGAALSRPPQTSSAGV